MISQARAKDLKVLYLICVVESTSFASLNENTQIPIRTLKEILSRLNTSIEELLGIESFINSSRQGEIFIDQTNDMNKFEVLFKLRLQWYQETNEYKLLSLVSMNNNLTKQDVMEKLFISEATFQRLFKKCNNYLSQFQIQLEISNGEIQFAGRELNIRIFLFQSSYFRFFNIEWPDYFPPQNDIEKNVSIYLADHPATQTDIRLRGSYLLVAILKQRFSQDCYIPKIYDSNIIEILSTIKKSGKLEECIQLFMNKVPSESQYWEQLILEHLIRIYVPDIDSNEEKKNMGYKFSLLDNPITAYATRLIDTLDRTILVDDFNQSKYSRIYHLVFFLLICQLEEKTLVPFIYMYFPKPTYHLYTDDYLMKQIKPIVKKIDTHTLNEFNNLISSFCYSLYITHIPKSVSIYLAFSKDFAAPYFIKNRLCSIFNPNQVLFTNIVKNADLIISDTFDLNRDAQRFFYLNHTNNREAWRDLLFQIQDLLSTKILNY